jgi:hypothetical protein
MLLLVSGILPEDPQQERLYHGQSHDCLAFLLAAISIHAPLLAQLVIYSWCRNMQFILVSNVSNASFWMTDRSPSTGRASVCQPKMHTVCWWGTSDGKTGFIWLVDLLLSLFYFYFSFTSIIVKDIDISCFRVVKIL